MKVISALHNNEKLEIVIIDNSKDNIKITKSIISDPNMSVGEFK